jgi:uncharacterized protein YecA (UPF0149 family)
MEVKQMAKTMNISRERKELISKYATAAVFLYGVISVEEFVEVFNNYERPHTTSEETALALTILAKTDDVEFSFVGGIISGYQFHPEFDDYEDNVEAVREAQRGKPHYLPIKDEFLKYAEIDYIEPEKPYADIKAYILEHKLSPRAGNLDRIDGDLIELHEMIQFGVNVTDEMNYFVESGYQYTVEQMKGFAQLLQDVHNNTRLYENNGHTPIEMHEILNRIKTNPSPKVGRNEPCPCGSGLKYKKCHGREI